MTTKRKTWFVRVDNGPGEQTTVTKHRSQTKAFDDVAAALGKREAGAPIEDIKVFVNEGWGPRLYTEFNDRSGWTDDVITD